MEDRRNDIQGEITALKMLLDSTDYKCLKYAEGALTDGEYSETRAQRTAWREKINALEAELAALDEANDA